MRGVQQWETRQFFTHQEQYHVITRMIRLLSCTQLGLISIFSRIALALGVPPLLYGWVRAVVLLSGPIWLVHPFPWGCPILQVRSFSIDEDSRLGKNVAQKIGSASIDMMKSGELRHMLGFGK